MSHEDQDLRIPLHVLLRENAKDAMSEAEFPYTNFDYLRSLGHLDKPPVGPGSMRNLLSLLAAVGRGDLSTGRIFEGHVNACWLIRKYGSSIQHSTTKVRKGSSSLFGVWNTDAFDAPLCLVDGKLQGKKSFASGADGLTNVVVTVTDFEGQRQMLLVPIKNLPVDRSWWKPVGMIASGSHIVDFSGFQIDNEHYLGEPNDYLKEPWFSAGACRFLAVQTGGLHAVFDITKDHLLKAKRAYNPYQLHRISKIGADVSTAYALLDQLAIRWEKAENIGSTENYDDLIASVNAARYSIERISLAVLDEAEKAIGAAGFLAPHPFQRLMRDLRTYLRQPNPDGALVQLGESIVEGRWSPDGNKER